MSAVQDFSLASTSLVEHKVLEHIKQALRVTLDWDAPVVSLPRKLSSIQFTMKSFRRHLERVITIEEEGGYLDDVVETRPNMEPRVQRLMGDHGRFRARIRQLMPMLDALNEWEEVQFGDICTDIRRLLNDVDRHDEAEIELLQEAMLMDEGGEG